MRTRISRSRISWRTIGAIAALLAVNSVIGVPAMAFDTAELGQGGSLVMQDIMPLIKQSPKLTREVADAASKINKSPNEIVCGGMRFSGKWTHLSAYRVSPYICAFGDNRFLEIRAAVHVTSRSGKIFEKATPEAMKNASRIRETKPMWRWLSEDPRLQERR